MANKAVFLDRDGILNVEIGDYVYRNEDFVVVPRAPEALRRLKDAGYILVVVTNQGGIAKGLYTAQEVWQFHQVLQDVSGNALDALYYSPYHDTTSKSLMRKPDSLMFERAIARFDIDPAQSWIVGDAERDLLAGHKVGVKGILVPSHKEQNSTYAQCIAADLYEATDFILSQEKK
ncbi:D-glycero-D-manno-heptose 1,7-bisphosphate phosphatase [Flexibacter flexilis DSM 6793]|uniref:D,D-heptose 1,7-bisphosphate phosphatase n=1 Tax=Flexibacter flexilis DSM 6793 TaxID=927664 RepID=A0A1I1GXH6_9BACT|nr:HAD-IIIA family hydrolase [Flexibacter flexilis]SFC16176.1 D-glycero-D-manno-heptose 1,7-bisphosphate phosphatase [Flexibacter flexilis DSM 6793]